MQKLALNKNVISFLKNVIVLPITYLSACGFYLFVSRMVILYQEQEAARSWWQDLYIILRDWAGAGGLFLLILFLFFHVVRFLVNLFLGYPLQAFLTGSLLGLLMAILMLWVNKDVTEWVMNLPLILLFQGIFFGLYYQLFTRWFSQMES